MPRDDSPRPWSDRDLEDPPNPNPRTYEDDVLGETELPEGVR